MRVRATRSRVWAAGGREGVEWPCPAVALDMAETRLYRGVRGVLGMVLPGSCCMVDCVCDSRGVGAQKGMARVPVVVLRVACESTRVRNQLTTHSDALGPSTGISGNTGGVDEMDASSLRRRGWRMERRRAGSEEKKPRRRRMPMRRTRKTAPTINMARMIGEENMERDGVWVGVGARAVADGSFEITSKVVGRAYVAVERRDAARSTRRAVIMSRVWWGIGIQ